VRFRLLPTDDKFFDLFNEASANVATCTGYLREVVAGTDKLESIIACEQRGDEITRSILQRLSTSFVTPFDREDIHALAEELDDVVDDVLDVVHKLRLGADVDLSEVPELKDQANLLVSTADEVVELMSRLESMKGIGPHLDSIDRLESEGDAVFRRALGRLLSGQLEPIVVIKLKDVVEAMEAALNTLEDISNLVESIVLKHA
jgi:uncharacterized protein